MQSYTTAVQSAARRIENSSALPWQGRENIDTRFPYRFEIIQPYLLTLKLVPREPETTVDFYQITNGKETMMPTYGMRPYGSERGRSGLLAWEKTGSWLRIPAHSRTLWHTGAYISDLKTAKAG